MKTTLFTLSLLFLAWSAKGDEFFYTNFNSNPFTCTSLITTNNTAVSSGYVLGGRSASGSFNLRCQQHASSGGIVEQTAVITLDATGKSNIIFGFGFRLSAAWANAMEIEWSIDGTNYNSIETFGTTEDSVVWHTKILNLPSGADNAAALRIRFRYTPNANSPQFPPNLRIDDFIVGADNSLPVSLSSFNSRLVNQQVLLSWETLSEKNNNYFSIERSSDAFIFEEIGQKSGAGDSQETQQYSFRDERPLSNKSYYRLRQVDFDGTFTFSPVVSVNMSSHGELTLSPVPARDQLRISLEKPSVEDGVWQVLDLSGRVLRSGIFPAETAVYELNASDMPEGVYVFHLVLGREMMAQKFWK